jgi:hypothetical protein
MFIRCFIGVYVVENTISYPPPLPPEGDISRCLLGKNMKREEEKGGIFLSIRKRENGE